MNAPIMIQFIDSVSRTMINVAWKEMCKEKCPNHYRGNDAFEDLHIRFCLALEAVAEYVVGRWISALI